MSRHVAVFGLLLFLGACSSSPSPPQTTTGTNIDPAVSGPLSAALAGQAQSLTGTSAFAALGASLALQAGVQADSVTLTASALAAPPPSVASTTRSRSGAVSRSGAASAFAFQLNVLNSPPGASNQVFSGVVLFQDAANAALGAGASSGGAIPPAVGLILEGGDKLWEGTAGQVNAQLDQKGGDCPPRPGGLTLPSYVTGCVLATFTNASLAITASTPFAGSASGSSTVSILPGDLVGAVLTVDCSQTDICANATSVGVSISPMTPTVTALGTQQFLATVTGTTNTAVTWSVEETTGGTVSNTGLYTAPATIGTYHVVATSMADPLESATAVVTVSATPVVAVSISPKTATVQTDGTQQFSATVTGSANTAVTWSVEESSGGTVSVSGLYTAPAMGGTYRVIVTSAADNTKSDTATVTVSTTPVITVSVSPPNPTLQLMATQQFTATVSGTSNQAVNWSVTEGSPGGTVSTSGLYTAPDTAGTYHVVATSAADASAFATAVVTVSAVSVAGFVADWSGPYDISEGSASLTGTVEFAVTAGAAANTVVINYLCAAPNPLVGTVTSDTSFAIVPVTCPVTSQSCTNASVSITGGGGTLANGELTIGLEGTISGLIAGECGVSVGFGLEFGPAVNKGP